MTAQEMFNELGFYKRIINKHEFIYEKQDKYNCQISETYGIGFDLNNKAPFFYCTCDINQFSIIKYFDIKVLKAIEKATEQLIKELGWQT